MRKEAKNQVNQLDNANVMSYHAGGHTFWNNDNSGMYVRDGFNQLIFFNSDRKVILDNDYNNVYNNQTVSGFGLEIEQGNSKNMSERQLMLINKNIVFSQLDKDLFKYQRDGSINGVECITQIMSKSFIRNKYNHFKDSFQMMRLFGMLPDERCGMHINMSSALFGSTKEQQATNISKILFLINYEYNFFHTFFGRAGRDLTYCRMMREWADFNYARFSGYHHIIESTESQSNHHVCFNYYHFNTGRVELRLPAGCSKWADFVRYLEMTFALVELSKKSWTEITLDNVKKIYEKNIDKINQELSLTSSIDYND